LLLSKSGYWRLKYVVANVNRNTRLVIDGRYLGIRPSGIGNYVQALIARLPELAPDIPIRLWVGSESIKAHLVAQHVEQHRVSSLPNGLMTLVGPWAMDRLTPDDLFHAPANILGFGLPCPSIVTVHDVMWIDSPNDCQAARYLRPISRAYYSIGIRHALSEARRILTVSHASANAIERIVPGASTRTVVAHNSYEPQFHPPEQPEVARAAAARILGFKEEFLLVVGQNQRSKGHEIAVRAFANSNIRDVRLVLVQRLATGKGLLNLALTLGLRERVRFVAELKASELVTMLQSARALLQPSYAEGFGLPVLEAAACGCPVIASATPALKEILEDAALYAAVGNVPDWTQAILRLNSDPDLRAVLRIRGLERAKWFSWDRTARATLQTYREILAEMR
jgi:glycosyltransferase involved in cell wall biosynthesis